jgi:hypothetical protein
VSDSDADRDLCLWHSARHWAKRSQKSGVALSPLEWLEAGLNLSHLELLCFHVFLLRSPSPSKKIYSVTHVTSFCSADSHSWE